jgi:tRNA(adenine34) deaminase
MKGSVVMTADVIQAGYTRDQLESFMREALALAEEAGLAGEMPIGAVVVIDGEIVSHGRARHQARRSQLAHAELEALELGKDRLWNDYERAVLISTVQPCPMCLGAAVMADVPHVVFAAHDALVQTSQTVETNPYVRRHITTWLGGILEAESLALIERFDPRMLAYVRGEPPASKTRALRNV